MHNLVVFVCGGMVKLTVAWGLRGMFARHMPGALLFY